MNSHVWLQRGQDGFAAVEAFVSSKIWGSPRAMSGDTALAVMNEGDPLGAVVYQNYCPDYGTIEMSSASTSARWMTRRTLFELYSYPFLQLGCQAVILRCDPGNVRMARINRAYGFKRYDIPRLRGRDKGEAIYVLTDDDWHNNGFHKELQNG